MESGASDTLEGHQGSIYCLAQAGAYLFSAGDDRGVKLWQYQDNKFVPCVELQGHTQPVHKMVTAQADTLLFSADRGGLVLMWGVGPENASQQPLLQIATNHNNVLMALWLEDSYIFTAALDGCVKVWDGAGVQQHQHMVTNQNGAPTGVSAMMLLNVAVPGYEGAVMITACDDKALKLWAMPTFEKRGILASRTGHADVTRCIAKGPGNSFFTGSMDHTIIVWEFGM